MMNYRIETIFTFILLAILVPFSNAFALELITRDVIEKEVITDYDLIKTTDNFIVVFDGSSSTNQPVPGTNIPKIKAAKMLLEQRNLWLPDLGYKCGLYLTSGWSELKTVQEMQPYNRQTFGRAIDSLPEKGKGNSLLMQAMLSLEKIIQPLAGRTTVILFTDGIITETSDPRTPVEIAQRIAQKHDVSFFIISSAEEKVNDRLLESVAKVNAASRVIPMQAYIKYPAYFTGTLFTVKVSSYVKLTTRPELMGFVAKDMLFDHDSDVIREEYHSKLEKLGRFLQEHPKTFVVLQGHSDNVGNEEYNLALSGKRADRVEDYLVENFNIDPERVITFWYGDLNPAADNGSEEGRQRNRRVEIAVGGLDQ